MNLKQIAFEETKQFSSLFLDYINNKTGLQKFYTYSPTIENFKEAIAHRNFDNEKRPALVNTLKNQYKNIPAPSEVSNNIESLGQQNTFTVTTGHQLNIFTGPLFFIYKVVAAINMAKTLNSTYPSNHFVPVYWMASEDHDSDEINNFRLFGEKYVWETDQKGPVGRFKTSSMKSLFEDLPEKPDFFLDGYLGKSNLSEATRYIVNHLFGKHGLVILDADDMELKKMFKPVILDDILHHTPFEFAQTDTKGLEDQGYKGQIYPRPINLFFMENGTRERIEESKGNFNVLNTSLSFTKEEIAKLIDEHPEKFSPNVVLRPVYQEMILPNLAYIGGPAEVAYWLQLKGVFDHFEIPFPILFPRLFTLIISKAITRKMHKLQVSEQDVFKDFNTLKESLLYRENDPSHDLSDQLHKIGLAFESIRKQAGVLDKSLEGFVLSEYKKVEKGVGNIQKRLKKAEEQKIEVQINQIKGILDKLFPNGNPQEREDNFLNFYINNPAFIDELIDQLDPFVLKFNILTEDE